VSEFTWFCLGMTCGMISLWTYFWKVRMLRSRKEWFAAIGEDDPNPDGWSYK
jgi:hypothetical protein